MKYREMTTGLLAAFTIVAMISAPHATRAQEPADFRQDLRSPDLRVLDEGVEDVGPLAESLRVLETGLSPYAGFDRVFEVPGYPDLLMRVEGGLFAVFPRSQYSALGAPIPSDTVFFIGPPLFVDTVSQTRERMRTDEEADADRGAWQRPDVRETPFITRPAWRTVEGPPAGSRDAAFLVDPQYRGARLRQLLLTAAASDGVDDEVNAESRGGIAPPDQESVAND